VNPDEERGEHEEDQHGANHPRRAHSVRGRVSTIEISIQRWCLRRAISRVYLQGLLGRGVTALVTTIIRWRCCRRLSIEIHANMSNLARRVPSGAATSSRVAPSRTKALSCGPWQEWIAPPLDSDGSPETEHRPRPTRTRSHVRQSQSGPRCCGSTSATQWKVSSAVAPLLSARVRWTETGLSCAQRAS
jgi:hypothetical protein